MSATEKQRAMPGLIASMVLFGTIGVFIRGIAMPSGVIAMARGLLGAAFLLLSARIRGRRGSLASVRKNAVLLLLSGLVLGMNWILLFEAYRYTTVATATICYYLAPVLVVLTSPLFLGERLTLRKILAAAAAFTGMLFISGVTSAGLPAPAELRGVLLGVGAACFYAGVMILNKRMPPMDAYDRTAGQLAGAGITLIPYCLLTARPGGGAFAPISLIMLLIVCVVHTGIAYLLYFGAMEHLSGQSVSMMGYIDPVVAVLCSALILREPITSRSLIGMALILGAAAVSELPGKKQQT